MYDYLTDETFLKKLDRVKIRTQYARITLLNFKDKPIREIQGNITGGSLNINSNSAVRRTISLSMIMTEGNGNIEDIANEISINKKIKVEIGYKNPFNSYKYYGDIVWFPCGVFVVSSASTQKSVSGWSISISGNDKMVFLNGAVGGTLPASVTFHEKYIIEDYEYVDEEGQRITVEYPTFRQIIEEAVHHWGGEELNNIIITDIDDTAKLMVKYIGDEPLYFSNDYQSFSYSPDANHKNKVITNQDVGYKETPFTYPGELILGPGETVVSLLDKICQTLGNYEYFYDVEGRFIFQQIKNYLNTYSPLNELKVEDYVKSYSNTKFVSSITDQEEVISLTRNPKYDNIKNDFIVWGKRKAGENEYPIRYRLTIDEKPMPILANQYFWKITDSEGKVVRYETTYDDKAPSADAEMMCGPCTEWREEIYRQALMANHTSSNEYGEYVDYYAEILAEWRKVYDPTNAEWQTDDIPDYQKNWNPIVFNDPQKLDWWLDFIDDTAQIGKYTVSAIGRRAKVLNDDSVKSVYNIEPPDILFVPSDVTINNDIEKHYNYWGQDWFQLTPLMDEKFVASSTGASAFERIRELLYQNLNYNTTISISCLPKYYLDVNQVIYIQDTKQGINGNYTISQISLPLAFNGTMSITASEVLMRV